MTVTDFYGIRPGAIPGYPETGSGTFMSVRGLPDRTVQNMAMFMDKLRFQRCAADAGPGPALARQAGHHRSPGPAELSGKECPDMASLRPRSPRGRLLTARLS